MVALTYLLRLVPFLAALTSAAPSSESHISKRTIVRDSNPGLIGSGYYPRATYLNDGATILSCIAANVGTNKVLQIFKSVDGGWNWSQIGSVATEVAATHDLDNCNLVTLPSGRVLAAFRNHDQTAAGNNSWYYYRLVICYSDDNGVNWSYLNTPVQSGTVGLGLWEPFLMNSVDGSLRMYYSYETNTNGNNQNNYVITSTNGGASFGAATVVSSCGSSTCRDGMVGVARLGSGSKNLVAVFESLAPDSGIHAVKSTDDGVTWSSTRYVVYKASSGDQGAPQIAYINGQLVVSFQTNEDDLTTNTADWDVKVVVSTDSGSTWGQKTTVLNSCNWAGVLTVDNTHLLVMCSSGGAALSQTMLLS